MSTDLVKYAFIAGEISPTLYGRTDLTKYDLAVAEGKNFFVDYRGGLSSRPGTKFVDEVKLGQFETRMFTFSFAPDVANSYMLLFGQNYIRFYQDGAPVLSGSTQYEISSPYTGDDLADLVVEQYRDLLRITSPNYEVYNLIRNDHDDWDLVVEDIAPFEDGVTITGFTTSTAGTAQVVFGVTKVFDDGSESAIGPPALLDNIVNYAATEGSVSITWARDADAVFYNVYRSIVAVDQDLREGAELGYVGRTHGTKFTDPNIIPDFTRVPPTHHNPFAPGAIEKINITAEGAGATAFATGVSITDPTGTGFVGAVVTNDSGAVVNVIVKSGGENYSSPTVSFTSGTATATADVRELNGTNPTLSAVFQQRQLYAATTLEPITIVGSRVKQFNNFSASDFVLDDDAFSFTLDTPAVAPIRHMIVTRGGLLAMTQKDVWLLTGGGANEPITPSKALAEPQSYAGVSTLKPIPIGNDLIFTEGKGHSVRMLSYNEVYRSYISEDKSILSSHLFGPGKDITRWAYQESPYKIVWGVREDGALLAFTSVKTEEVYAWTPCDTKGKFIDLVGLQEGTEDRIYVTTQRFIGGVSKKFIERMDLRQYVNVEDAWCVDCGLSLDATYPDGEIRFFHDLDTDVWTAETTEVLASPVGKFIRGGEGIFKVLSAVTYTLTLQMYAEPTNWVPETDETETFSVPEGSWTADTPVDNLSGLDHLEGEEVAILGDGNVFARQTVVGGAITLDAEVTRAIVGLPFTCRAKTLPVIVQGISIEAKRKRVVGVGVRMDKSRGIKIGPTLDRMQPMRERTTENYGFPTRLVNGMHYQLSYSEWNQDGQVYFVQEDPLPCNILSIVADAEVGDEPD